MSEKLTTEISNEDFWRNLGIDIEKHDELMKVLPVVYQNVYLTQTNRPKNTAYFDNFIADIHGARPKEVFERKKSGAIVVAEESCTGTRYFSDLVEANSGSVNTQLKNLAERYLHINCACFTPNAERPEDVVRLAKEYNADGVVYYVLQFCHEFNIEFAKVERALKEEGIPVIKIETDYSQSDTGQLKTRLETFIEILKSSKAKSKQIAI